MSLVGPVPLDELYAIRRLVDFVAERSVTENGKVCKGALRERSVDERTWDREASGYRLSRVPRCGR